LKSKPPFGGVKELVRIAQQAMASISPYLKNQDGRMRNVQWQMQKLKF